MSAKLLQVGGLVPLTTIDYPGKLAAVIFCQGCPWRCHYCHNQALQCAKAEQPPLTWNAVLDFLQQRRGLLDAVVFSGGEPTAQPRIKAALAQVRSLGFLTGMHSAGVYPRRLQALLPLLDWIGLDVKALPQNYPRITAVNNSGKAAWQSVRHVIQRGVAHQFRIPLAPELSPAERHQIKQQLHLLGAREVVETRLRPATC